MESLRTLLGLVFAIAVAASAIAQSGGSLRWRGGGTPLGLQAGGEVRLPCPSYTLSCGNAASVPLYASEAAPRSLSMQLSPDESGALASSQGLDVNLVGQAGIVQDLGLGVYGRVGTTVNRTAPAWTGAVPGEAGLRYGVGLSWDFARSASAAFGLDSYDIRGFQGEGRDLRTSLGLRWRY